MHHCGSVVVSNDDLAPEHRQPSRWQYVFVAVISWWCHQMETFSALLAICAGNSPGTQGQVTRSFNVFFDLRPNKRLIKQSWGWWFERISRPLWRHCNMCGFTVVRLRLPQIIPLGLGKLSQFSPFRYYPIFRIVKTLITCMIARSYFTGVTAAQLWRHLTNMNVV